MSFLSYKSRFVESVEAELQKPRPKRKRIKRQTIRAFRKHPIKPGETLYHYFGQRTKWCRKLGESVCKSVDRIEIWYNHIRINPMMRTQRLRDLNSYELRDIHELNAFARADGFRNWEEMRQWWMMTHGPKCFPFVGQLIKW